MLLARNPDGSGRPYFDEVGLIVVTSPCGEVRGLNMPGWQAACAVGNGYGFDGSGTDGVGSGPSGKYGRNNVPRCGGAPNSATDISNLFSNEQGTFDVSLVVLNGSSPVGWSTAYVVPL